MVMEQPCTPCLTTHRFALGRAAKKANGAVAQAAEESVGRRSVTEYHKVSSQGVLWWRKQAGRQAGHGTVHNTGTAH